MQMERITRNDVIGGHIHETKPESHEKIVFADKGLNDTELPIK